MASPFLIWKPNAAAPGSLITAVRRLPSGNKSCWAVVTTDDIKSTLFLISDGSAAQIHATVSRKQRVKIVDAVFSANLWKIIVLYEDFTIFFVEPSNGQILKDIHLMHGLNNGSVATSFAMHPSGNLVAIGYTLDHSVPKKVRLRNKEQYEDYDEDEAFLHNIDLIDLRNPQVPIRTYEDLHSATVQSLQFCPTSPTILMSGGADGLVNWIDTSIEVADDGLLATNLVVSPVDHIGFVGSDAEGRLLAACVTDDSKTEFYRIVQGKTAEEFDVMVTHKRSAGDSNRFLVDIVGSGSEELPFVVVESTKDGKLTLKATSTDGKRFQVVGDFKDHRELVRCVYYEGKERRVITGDEAGNVVGRNLQSLAKEAAIEEAFEEMGVNEDEAEEGDFKAEDMLKDIATKLGLPDIKKVFKKKSKKGAVKLGKVKKTKKKVLKKKKSNVF